MNSIQYSKRITYPLHEITDIYSSLTVHENNQTKNVELYDNFWNLREQFRHPVMLNELIWFYIIPIIGIKL